MDMTKEVEAGQAVYSRFILALYDFQVLNLSNKFLWKCDTDMLVQNYNTNISNNHLEIGVGTGFFLDRCQFPTPTPDLALMDLNENSLEVTRNRISRYNPVTYRRNVLEPFLLGPQKYDSIGMNYLLHCLPGTIKSKAVVFDHAREVLNTGGSIFGSTLVQSGVDVSWAAQKLMNLYNQRGIFCNDNDAVDDLDHALSSRFSEYTIDICGCGAIFSAKA